VPTLCTLQILVLLLLLTVEAVPVVIAAKNDSNDVLADVVDVSFHRRNHQRANICTVLS